MQIGKFKKNLNETMKTPGPNHAWSQVIKYSSQ